MGSWKPERFARSLIALIDLGIRSAIGQSTGAEASRDVSSKPRMVSSRSTQPAAGHITDFRAPTTKAKKAHRERSRSASKAGCAARNHRDI